MRTLKWIMMMVVSVGIGTFMDVNVLEKAALNVWLSRGIGCLIAVAIALILYHFLLKKKASESLSRNEPCADRAADFSSDKAIFRRRADAR